MVSAPGGTLFPTMVVGSLPRPQWLRDLIEDRNAGRISSADAERLLDGFVTKLNSTGAIVYSTFLGGSGIDGCGGVAVDADGNVYVAGSAGAQDFPTTTDALQRTYGGGSVFATDAFVAKLNADGSELLYSTLLGGNDDDLSYSIALTTTGNIYVSGHTGSEDFPVFRRFS